MFNDGCRHVAVIGDGRRNSRCEGCRRGEGLGLLLVCVDVSDVPVGITKGARILGHELGARRCVLSAAVRLAPDGTAPITTEVLMRA